MTKKAKQFLQGLGSVLDIAPDTDYQAFIDRDNASERIAEYWDISGKYLKSAVEEYDSVQESSN